MFESWSDTGADSARRKRFFASTGAAVAVYGALGAGVLVLAKPTLVQQEKVVEVTFEKAPPKKVEAPPPPPPKRPPPRKPPPVVQPTVAVQQLVVPKELPKEKPPEADPGTKVAQAGDAFGTTGAVGSGGPATPAPIEEPEPAPPPKKKEDPVTLPEDAEPAMPEEDNTQPTFPEDMRAAGKEGLVILKIVVKLDGSVGAIQVMKGDEPFVSAALAVVKTWRYTPAMLDGQAITTYKIVKIPFRLGVGG